MKRFSIAIAALCALACSLFLVHRTGAQTVVLAPVPHMQFLNSSGQPLAGGCVFTYAAGTTTPLATYTDSTGTISNPNPIVLDSGGFANIWLSQTGYKFTVYSNGGVNCSTGTYQWSVDNITTPSGSGSGVASSLLSAAPNPATGSGIIRMAASDTICWRNSTNSQNLCLLVGSQGQLIWQNGISLWLTEGAAPVVPMGQDAIYADSTATRMGMVNDGGPSDLIVGQKTVDILTNKTFDTAGAGNVLKISGNPVSATVSGGNTLVDNGSTGAALTSAALTTPVITGGSASNLALATPTIGGITITNVPQMAWTGIVYCSCFSVNAINAGLTVLDTNQGGIVLKNFYVQMANPGFLGCSTYPAWQLYDETAGAPISGSTITAVSGTQQYTATVNQNVPMTHVLDMRGTQAATGCSNAPNSSVGATAMYIMQ